MTLLTFALQELKREQGRVLLVITYAAEDDHLVGTHFDCRVADQRRRQGSHVIDLRLLPSPICDIQQMDTRCAHIHQEPSFVVLVVGEESGGVSCRVDSEGSLGDVMPFCGWDTLGLYAAPFARGQIQHVHVVQEGIPRESSNHNQIVTNKSG